MSRKRDHPPRDGRYDLGEFPLELGGTLPDAFIDVRVHGSPTTSADNVVLFPHMYSGGVASLDAMIGVGRPLDPSRYCIVVPGQLGNGVATSPSNWGHARFPQLTFGDDFHAQSRLLAHLHFDAPLSLVVGYSMGACQAYEWAVRAPDRVCRLAAIAGTARTTPRAAALIEQLAQKLELKPPATGLAEHARLWAVLGVSPRVYDDALWSQIGFATTDEFICAVFEDDFARLDPRDLTCQLRKWRRGDVSHLSSGDLRAALGRISADTLVIPLAGDPFSTLEDCVAESLLIARSEVRPIETAWGHYAFAGFDPQDKAAIDDALADLLSS